MNKDDLVARARAATIRWRSESDHPEAGSLARDAHARLLQLVESAPGGNRQVAQATRAALFGQLRALAQACFDQSRDALERLDASKCTFSEGKGRGSYRCDMWLPHVHAAAAAVRVAPSLASLAMGQQLAVLEYLRAELALHNDEAFLKMEAAEGTLKADKQLEADVARSQDHERELQRRLNGKSVAWIQTHRDDLNLLAHADAYLPVLPGPAQHRDVILRCARTLGTLSEWLLQPMELDRSAGSRRMRVWVENWRACEQAAEGLAVVSAWLRVLGSGDEYHRCEVCYRHVGAGMKKNCSLHYHTAAERPPARDRRFASVYRRLVQDRISSDPETRKVVQGLTAPERPSDGVVKLARRARVPEALVPAAARLDTVLRELYPVVGTPMRSRMESVLQQLLEAAKAASFQKSASTRQARNGSPGLLSWENFFKQFFMAQAGEHLASPANARRALDLDHPLVPQREIAVAVSLMKVALDIIHLDTWSRFDVAYDGFSYLDVHQLRAERDSGLTLKEIGRRHGVSAQAVHKALRSARTSPRRKRSLGAGLNALEEAVRAQLASEAQERLSLSPARPRSMFPLLAKRRPA